MMDEVTQQRKLLESLYIKTTDGELQWQYDAAEDLCETSIGDGYIQVSQETDDEGDYYPIVKILNNNKEVIDRLTGGYLLMGKIPFYTSHKNYWELIRELRIKAERSAKGADLVINSILESLNAGTLVFENNDDLPF